MKLPVVAMKFALLDTVVLNRDLFLVARVYTVVLGLVLAGASMVVVALVARAQRGA